MTEANSLREWRHLAVQRGRPLGKKLLGTQRESAAECTGEPWIGTRETSVKNAEQVFCRRPQLKKVFLKGGPEMSFLLASNQRISQSDERMGMSRDRRVQVSCLENCRLRQTLLA